VQSRAAGVTGSDTLTIAFVCGSLPLLPLSAGTSSTQAGTCHATGSEPVMPLAVANAVASAYY